MAIRDNSIEAVKDAVRIEEVIGDFLPELKKKGAHYEACCPFHNEKSPSFTVNPVMGIYKCFGCGESGDAIKYLMVKEGKDFMESIQWLAEKYGIALEYENPESAEDKQKRIGQGQVLRAAHRAWVSALLEHPVTNTVCASIDYAQDGTQPSHNPVEYLLAKRMLGEEEILDWELGFAPNESKFLTGRIINSGSWEPAYQLGIVKSQDGNNYDFFRNRIIYPIHNHRGELVGFGGRSLSTDEAQVKKYGKFLNSPESDRYNKSKVLFGLHKAIKPIREKKVAILTEGYNDVIMMHKAGLQNTVASCGTAFTDEQAALLSRWAEEFTIFYDGDEAGAAATRKAVDVALRTNVKVTVCRPPAGHDPDSYVREHLDCLEVVGQYIHGHKTDGFMWKALQRLAYWGTDEPDNYAQAVDEICEMLSLISHPTKKQGYLDKLNKELKLPKKMLQKRLDAIVDEKLGKQSKRDRVAKEESVLPASLQGTRWEDTWERHGLFEMERHTYFAKADYWAKEANFTLQCLYLVKRHEDEPMRIFEMKNEFDYKEKLAMPIEAMTSIPRFTKLTESHGNYRFWGNQNSLNRWKGMLYEQERVITEVSPLGWFPSAGFYAFANGVFYDGRFHPTDEDGLVEKDGHTYFIRANSSVQFENQQGFEFEKRFRHIESDINFTQWASMIHRVYRNDGIMMACFVMAAVHRNIIFGRFKFFPILNIFGTPGSGKNTMVQSVLHLFGEPQEMFNLHSGTVVGFKRKLSQGSDGVVSFTEYKNDIDHKIVEALKSTYDGIGHEKGVKSNDNRTTVTKVLSAVMIDGQHMPNADIALMERIIYISLHNRDDYDHEGFNALKKQERDGVTNVLLNMLDCREEMLEQFDTVFDETLGELYEAVAKQMGANNVKDRIMKNYTVAFAAYKVMAPKLGSPFRLADVKSTIVNRIIDHAMQLRSGADVAQFWQIVNSLFNAGIIHQDKELNVHMMKRDGVMKKMLVIRLNVVHPLYLKEFKGTRLKSEGMEMSALLFYLKGSEEFIDTISGHRFGDFNTSGHIFDYEMLVEKYDIVLERTKKDPMAATVEPDKPTNPIDFSKLNGQEKPAGIDDELPF